MKRNKKYRALKRLINKITKSDSPFNNSFYYYKYKILQYSGTVDYTDITIMDYEGNKVICSFTFDFLLKELNFEEYKTVEIRNVIIEAFKECYEGVKLSITDESLNEEIKDLENTFASYSPDFFDEEEYKKMLKNLEDLKKERKNL